MVTLITIGFLILIAYLFDITAIKTRIPSVILLILLGFFIQQIAYSTKFVFPNFTSILPILGTFGLAIIVLEGALEVELEKSKIVFLRKAIYMSIIQLILVNAICTVLVMHFFQTSFLKALCNTIPISVISSAIAIPSAAFLKYPKKDFITYESSLSDIFGVLIFNFLIRETNFTSTSYIWVVLQLVFMAVLSIIAILLLSVLLNRIKHKVKFVPIIIITLLVFSITKYYHLPSLLFVFLLGLTLNNLKFLSKTPFFRNFDSSKLSTEVVKLKELLTEISFLIRSLFFILFGMSFKGYEIVNTQTLPWAFLFSAVFFIVRYLLLVILKIPKQPIFTLAPKGLISILLFLSVPSHLNVSMFNKSLLVQIVFISAFIMMFGIIVYGKGKDSEYTTPSGHIPEESV